MVGSTQRIRSQSKRGRNGTGARNEEEESSSRTAVEDESTPPLETPRVLTRGIINSLTHGLDASDVVECYALRRSAPLHGIANSTITIQKMTIGIRYRPKAADLKNPYNVKTPMELTLEYGPARLGPLLSDEATPIVQGNDESSSYLAWDNTGKVYFTQKIVTDNFLSSHYMASMTGAVLKKLLSEAVEYTERRKVYQPFAIYSDNDRLLLRSSSSSDFTWYVWTHLASLGVEIEPILPPAIYEARLYTKSVKKVFADQSVTREAATFYQRLYTCLESIATKNYGSFLSFKEQSIANDDNDDSTSSSGTTSQHAKVGGNRALVSNLDGFSDLKSGLAENMSYEKRRGLEDEAAETEVPENKIPTKPPKLVDIEAKVGEDVTKTEAPTDTDTEVIDTQTKSEAGEDVTETEAPTDVNTEVSDTQPEVEAGEDVTELEEPKDAEIETDKDEESEKAPNDAEEEIEEEVVFAEDIAENIVDEDDLVVQNSMDSENLATIADLDGEDDEISGIETTESTTVTQIEEPSSVSLETLSPTDGPTEGIQDVEKAQNAANDAQKAADEAKIAAKTEGETKAADAAQAAADAALAAADATSSAASQAAMDSLLSGDGTMMSSIVSTCFSNPKYEISSSDANRTAPTEIYLFKDPSTYYKLELTSPYVGVVKLNKPLPIAVSLLSDNGTGGDALDWTLAIGISLSMLLMVLLICQQMGKRYVESVFNCQRWFFNPRNYDNEEESSAGVQSGSHFFFGKSGIPVSMGGMRSSYSPLKNEENLNDVIVNQSSADDENEHNLESLSPKTPHVAQELEMINFGSPDVQEHVRQVDSESSSGSSEDDEMPLEIPDRLLRNPDLVELPSLKSKSKVAIPVGRQMNGNGNYSRSSSLGDGSLNSPTNHLDLTAF